MYGRYRRVVAVVAVALCVSLVAGAAWSKYGFRLDLRGAPSLGNGATGANTMSTLPSERLTELGRERLAAHDIVCADKYFADALKGDPANQTANFLRAATRILVIVQDQKYGPDPTSLDSVREFMDAFGVQGPRDIYSGFKGVTIPLDAHGRPVITTSTPSPRQVADFMAGGVAPEIDAAVANLDATGREFTVALASSETTAPYGILVDHGDIAMMKAALLTAKAAILISDAYNTDVDPETLYNAYVAGGYFLDIKADVLDPNPSLLTPSKPLLLPAAKAALKAAIASYMDGSKFIREERPADRRGNLVVLDPKEAPGEALVRANMAVLDHALDNPGPMDVFTKEGTRDVQVNIPRLFDTASPVNPRALLPQVGVVTSPDGSRSNRFIKGTVPDKTFSGLVDGYVLSGVRPHDGYNAARGMAAPLSLVAMDVTGVPANALSIKAEFSNGDAPVALVNHGDPANPDTFIHEGYYTADWVPGSAGPVTITFTATDGSKPAAHAVVHVVVVSPTSGSVNDECSTATVISTLPATYMVDTTRATSGAGEPAIPCIGVAGTHSVWFTFTPSQTGWVSIDTTGSGYYPVFDIFGGDCLGLTDLGLGCRWGKTEIYVDAGKTYYIRFSDVPGGAGGMLRLDVSMAPGGAVPPLPASAFHRASAPATGSADCGFFSGGPSLSRDGSFIAFESDKSCLTTGDSNGFIDVFVRGVDTNTGALLGINLVSVPDGGGQGDGNSMWPSISGDGSKVAFQSDATNLVAGDTNGWSDIFVRDIAGGKTTRVSVASDGTQGNCYSYRPIISGDGGLVLFLSDSSNLVPGDTNGQSDLFLRDMRAGTTKRVSLIPGAGGVPVQLTSGLETAIYALSPDGGYVLFFVTDTAASSQKVYRYDTAAGTVKVVANTSDVTGFATLFGDPAWPWVSDNGRFYVSFTAGGALGVVDSITREVVPVGNMTPMEWVISGDGRYMGVTTITDLTGDEAGEVSPDPDVYYVQNPLWGKNSALVKDVAPANGGWVTADPDAASGLYKTGATVSLNAVPAQGFTFTGWTGDATGVANPLTVTMSKDIHVTATFTADAKDTTAPMTHIKTPGDGSTLPPGHEVIGGSSHDGMSGVRAVSVRVNGGAWTGAKIDSGDGVWAYWSLPWTPPAPGVYHIEARATDNAGNTETPMDAVVVTIPESPMLNLGSVRALKGGKAVVPITLRNTAGVALAATSDDLAFDTARLNNPLATVGPAGSEAGKSVFTSRLPDGSFRVGVFATDNNNPIPDGVVAYVSFDIAADAPDGDNILANTPSASGRDGALVVVGGADGLVHVGDDCSLTLTPSPTAGGSVAANPAGPYRLGDKVTLTPSPAAGYAFSNWAGDATGSASPLELTMDGNNAVIAVFKLKRTLAIGVSGNGSVTASPDHTGAGGYYLDGDTVRLTPNAATGYVFTGWTGNATGTANPLDITMDADKNITATFKARRALTVTASEGGSVGVNPDKTGSYYIDDETVQLTAKPSLGYAFTGWSGDATGTANPATVVMDKDKSVKASFRPYPQISEISPAKAGGGALVRLTGKGFGSSGTLTVGTVRVRTASWSDTVITFHAPARLAAGKYHVKVTLKNGDYTKEGIQLEMCAPVITGCSPNPATRGATVIVTGGYFGARPIVRATPSGGGRAATVRPSAVTDTSITFTVPMRAAPGSYNLTVGTAQGTSAPYVFHIQ